MAPAAARGLEDGRAVRVSPPVPGAAVRNVSYSARSTTRTAPRIVECPSPQSSVQTIENSPFRFGVITSVVSMPGTASDLLDSGTQNA